ncbi:MAG: RNA polymerase sigma factor [Solirubrobacteraceae bacterium]
MSPRFSLSEVFLRTQSDARLCVLAGDGHPRAFAMLVERHQAALIRTAARVGGVQRAEDAVQEALLRAWAALRSGTRVEHIPSWLHQIVRNTVLNHIARERGRTEPLPDQLADPQSLDATLDERLFAHDLLAQIAVLPECQRTALVETELGGRSRRDIAADLGLSEGAVRGLVHRARSAVRVAMTALTPYPLAAWVARRSADPGAVDRLVGMLPPTGSGRSGLFESLAGSVTGGGALLKGGAVIIAAGALGGGVGLRELIGAPAHHRVAVVARRAGAARRPPVVTAPASEPSSAIAASYSVLTAFSGTARAPSPRVSELPARTPRLSSAGATVPSAGGDQNGAVPTTANPSTSDGVSSESSISNGPSTSRGSSSDRVSGSSSGSVERSSASSSGSADRAFADSSAGSIPDATPTASTAVPGGD